MLIILAWLAVAYVVMSIVEYVAHRWLMHGRLLQREHHQHAVLHHGRYYPGRAFEYSRDPAARYISVDLHPLFMLAGLSPLWLSVLWFSRTGGIVLACSCALHGFLWTMIHREMHEPQGRWFASTRLYRYLRAHHLAHHQQQGRNFNIICLGMDFVMATYAASSNIER